LIGRYSEVVLVDRWNSLHVGIAVAKAESGKQRDSDPSVGAPPPAAERHNTAATHLRIDRRLLVKSRGSCIQQGSCKTLFAVK